MSLCVRMCVCACVRVCVCLFVPVCAGACPWKQLDEDRDEQYLLQQWCARVCLLVCVRVRVRVHTSVYACTCTSLFELR